MKTTALILAASAALASAQATYNETDGKYHCAKPNAAYCAGDSLGTNIIIRCNSDSIGQPGNCNDNLDGEPPIGLAFSPCWETSKTSGDAACSKNCIVYGSSGNANGTFTLPSDVCTPTYTATSTSVSSTSSVSATSTTVSVPANTTVTTTTPCPESTTSTFVLPSETITTLLTSTTTYCPPPLSTGASSSILPPPANGTITTGSATATPISPTTTTTLPSGIATAGASANKVGGALAAVGLLAAAML
ncbi:hypothetical protein NKR23_g1296 [Pleurostoma richardsiae]|uniref:Uncharacterized protein n=1 Tax=Pleurostoma richardsiae TaxID=41990 RepID=A0AA38VZM0_9PEZI|nr:hypothetical protein NKR23_g1296 [Pleurostoma richardsiae]